MGKIWILLIIIALGIVITTTYLIINNKTSESLQINNYNTTDDYSNTTKESCILGGGTWSGFPNTCRDRCVYKRNVNSLCGEAITIGCDCPENQCWDGINCVEI